VANWQNCYRILNKRGQYLLFYYSQKDLEKRKSHSEESERLNDCLPYKNLQAFKSWQAGLKTESLSQ
jgi:hypothetical protein